MIVMLELPKKQIGSNVRPWNVEFIRKKEDSSDGKQECSSFADW